MVRVQRFTFDFAGLEDIQRQRLEFCLFLKGEAEALHPAQKAALPMPDVGQRRGQGRLIPVELGPFGEFVDES